MGGHELLYIILIIIFLLFSALFSGSETAFLSLQRVRLEHMVSNNVRGARRVAKMIEKPEKLLSVVLLGNNLVNTAAAALVTALAVSLWGEQGIIIATVIITIVILIFAETTPKTFAAQHAEKLRKFDAYGAGQQRVKAARDHCHQQYGKNQHRARHVSLPASTTVRIGKKFTPRFKGVADTARHADTVDRSA